MRRWFNSGFTAAAASWLLLAAGTGCLPSSRRAVAIWIVSGGEELTHDTLPSPENDVYSAAGGGLHLTAALNETVAFQIGLRTTAPPAGPFNIEITDLVGPADKLSARSAVTIYRVHYQRIERFRSWYPSHRGKPTTPTLFPDILVPWEAPRGGGPLVLGEARNEIIWVDVHVPPTLAPGQYRGRLALRSDATGVPVFACEIHLEVLPVALPGRRNLPVVCRVDPRDLLAAHLRWPRTSAEQTRLLPEAPSHFAAVRLVNATMRLFHEHRTTPILWASFPKFRLVGQRKVEVQWDEYDQLVSGWLDGSAFRDQVRLEVWPIPAALEYPNAERNGGFDSPQYARLLAAYLAECKEHFAQRGWLERAVTRLCPPEPLSQAAADRLRRLSGIVRQSETDLPIMAHLPARSLRGLGWHEAPSIALPDVTTWAPPAMWYEPAAMAHEQRLGKHAWLMPDRPPYSGSLAVEAPATEAWILPWLAYRYGVEGLWIEHAAEDSLVLESPSARQPWQGPGLGSVSNVASGLRPGRRMRENAHLRLRPGRSPDATLLLRQSLVYSAEEYGLRERGPVPSLRLKRLRRGLQDYELLRLLEANGQELLARKLAEQVVRWAATEACLENLLSTKESGWSEQTSILRRARTLILRELVSEFEPSPNARREQLASLSEWLLMFNQADLVNVSVDGVRVTSGAEGLHADVMGSVSNATNRAVEGHWTLPVPPPGWQQVGDVPTEAPPGTRRTARIGVDLTGLAYNIDGVYPFEVVFDTVEVGAFLRPARLAVAACRPLQSTLRIDGKLDDWPLASNNAAGDFRLCRGRTFGPDKPTLPTQAYFCMDREHLYVGLRCTLNVGEPPVWQADNAIPIDGTIPWGQDVVEILIDPRPTAAGTSSELYCLQIKPSGLLLARKGCRTDPPMGISLEWHSRARVAVNVEREVWVVELAVPWDAFEPRARRNNLWGCNVTRLDARRGEYSSWSGAHGHCYSPQSLGNLIMLWP